MGNRQLIIFKNMENTNFKENLKMELKRLLFYSILTSIIIAFNYVLILTWLHAVIYLEKTFPTQYSTINAIGLIILGYLIINTLTYIHKVTDRSKSK